MKRSLLFLLVVAVGLVTRAPAEPPSLDPQEPPVRLRKKKKSPKPKIEHPGPEKPDEPKKPGPEEDNRLDNKDDLKLSGKETPDEQEILQRVAKNARASEDRLSSRELGEGTRQLQDDIVKDIDKLIERAKQNNQNNSNKQNKQNQQQAGQGGKKGKSSAGSSSARSNRQRRQARRQSRRGSSGRRTANNQGSRGSKPDRTARNRNGNRTGSGRGSDIGEQPGGGGAGARAPQKPGDRKFDLWGHLPERERNLMNKEMEQKFMEKYDELTRQFYRIIAEKSRRKK